MEDVLEKNTFYVADWQVAGEAYSCRVSILLLPLPLPLPLPLGPIYEFISKGGSHFSRVMYLEYIPM